MARSRVRSPIPGVVISLVVASIVSAAADTFVSDCAVSGNGVHGSVAAVFRKTAESDSGRGAIEPAARPRALPADPEFGTQQFPRFDGSVDSPPDLRPPVPTQGVWSSRDSMSGFPMAGSPSVH